MYTRVAKFKLKKSNLKEARITTDETIRPAIEKMDGIRLLLVTIDPDSNEGTAIAVYHNRESAGEAQEIIKHIWGTLSPYLTGPPEISEQETVMWIEDQILRSPQEA